ncbi:MAG TPA: DeoR/GlpR transcriptional regulator, partial [Spirochaetia bacterium]
VIRALREKRVTVVTNAINVAMDLAAAESVEVVVTGGTLRTRSYELVGHIAESTIRNFRLDIALIGVDGLDFTYGLSTFTITEAQAAAMYIDHAREVWVVADHTKIGRTVPGLIAPLSRVHRVITDANVGSDVVDAFAAAGVPLSIAPV